MLAAQIKGPGQRQLGVFAFTLSEEFIRAEAAAAASFPVIRTGFSGHQSSSPRRTAQAFSARFTAKVPSLGDSSIPSFRSPGCKTALPGPL